MNRNILHFMKVFFVFTGLITIGINISKAEITPREIMEKESVATKVKNSTAASTFTLISKAGQMRIRKVFGATKLEPNEIDNIRMTRFLSPPDVKGTVILLIEHSEKDDDIWIYLPGLKKVRRMLSSNKRDSYAGTDFSYGDVIGHKVGDWEHHLLKEEAVDGQASYVIESIPKNETVKENSGYSKRLSWIQKDNFVTIKEEFWDESGRPLKTFTATNVQIVDPVRGRWQPMRLEMVNMQTGHKTIIQMENFKANQVINDEFFTTRYMERE